MKSFFFRKMQKKNQKLQISQEFENIKKGNNGRTRCHDMEYKEKMPQKSIRKHKNCLKKKGHIIILRRTH